MNNKYYLKKVERETGTTVVVDSYDDYWDAIEDMKDLEEKEEKEVNRKFGYYVSTF